MGDLAGKIEHVVVLMLENRSFDSMLGRLYPKGYSFNGLSGDESNPLAGAGDVRVWGSTVTDPVAMSIPDPDPGELWTDINMQLFGLGGAPGPGRPTMDGFVDNYVRQTAEPGGHYKPEAVMHYYEPTELPVLSRLARQFAVCDQWFASAPCQTWPNRFFLHCATAYGYENNSPTHFPYMMETVFNRFEHAGRPWKVYFHDFPQSLTLTKLWPHLDHFHSIDDFLEDAKKGALPDYAFIEPRYFPDLEHLPNDQHPPHHVGMGEDLIARVYNAVRQSPVWQKTLLVIIYDEHGGCFDHAPPPRALPPDDGHARPFAFDRYGVRIPAVLVSPYIQQGTVLRAELDGVPHSGPPYPFDHASVFATLREIFGDLGGPLTERDRVAPDLGDALNLDAPDNNGPASVAALPYPMSEADIQKALAAPLNDFQRGLHEAAFYLPELGGEGAADRIEAHVKKIADAVLGDVPAHNTPADAVPFIKQRLEAFFGK